MNKIQKTIVAKTAKEILREALENYDVFISYSLNAAEDYNYDPDEFINAVGILIDKTITTLR